MKKLLTCAGLACLFAAGLVRSADKPYQYDPQKYAEVKHKQCQGFLHEIDLLDRRKKQGVRPWEKARWRCVRPNYSSVTMASVRQTKV